MNQKGFSSLLIIVLIAFLIGGFMYYKKQSAENPYINTQYKFQVVYPHDWLVGEEANKSLIYFRPKSLQVGDPGYGVVTIGVEEGSDLTQYLQNRCENQMGKLCDISKAIDIEIDGVKGKRLNNIPGALPIDQIFVQRSNYIYTFSTTVGPDEADKNRASLEAIVSRFKFIN